jgi:hypothetical protein
MDPSQIDLPLKDIHLPPPVGWWPLAPGWWVLAILVPALIYGAYRLWRRLRQPHFRREGMRELERLVSDGTMSPLEKVQQISILLRRIALSTRPRAEVAGLQGDAWLEWLEDPLQDGRFRSGPGRVLAAAPYALSGPDPADLEALFALCRDWLKRVPART